MNQRTRRQVLGAGAALVAGGGAGCLYQTGATTPNDPDSVGETAAVNGIEITFHGYEVTSELTYVPRGERVLVADEAPDMESRTVEPRRPDYEFLVPVLTIANVSDDEKRIPTPAPDGMAFAEGRIFLELGESEVGPVPVNPDRGFAVGGAYPYQGSWYDRLVLVVGDVRGSLPAESSASGWMLYEIPADVDRDQLVLVANANPTGPNKRLTWPLDGS